jgi:N-methylhydantoinase B
MNDAAAIPDPIGLEIIHNALRSITDEMFIALMKSAYSTNIKERHDHSTTLMDANGRLVAQSDFSLPIHLASIKGLMDCILSKYGADDIQPGDIFIGNDPYVAGGTHLPDVNMAMPIFLDDRIVGWACNLAHHADIGGMAPGSMAGGMTEIFQEGLRIPLVRLFDRGQLRTDILDLLLLNVRVPEERRGDYFAQIAACRLGERRLHELLSTCDFEFLAQAMGEIIARTESRMRAAFSTIPAGTYRFEDVMDNDGIDGEPIAIKVQMEVGERRLRVHFDGSSPQVKGNINAPLNATQSAVYYALKALLDPDVPNNQGVMDAVEIVAPLGSIVNCTFPAAVAARAHLCQRVVDVIIGALASALPAQVIGASNGANTTLVLSGNDPKTGKQYVYLETLGGGFGGRAGKDGKDAVQVHMTNTSNLPVEAIEMEYPLIVEAYELIPDSGGAGKYRGGLGLRRVIRPAAHSALFNGQGERFSVPPWGIFGAEPGAVGRFLLVDGSGGETPLPSKPIGVTLHASQAIKAETPGAGGYGQPRDRDRQALEADYRSGKYSRDFLRTHYQYDPLTDTRRRRP